MKTIVFGATGTIGRLTVRQLLSEGHTVTAFARNPHKLGFTDPNLAMFSGDASDAGDVSNAIKEHDVVVITLGSGMSRKSTIRSVGTMNVIRGMQKQGVDRLICQSTLGAHESWSNLNFFWKRIMFSFLLRPVFKDHELQENLVRASGLNYTIVRPSAFTDDIANGGFNIDVKPTERKLSLKIPRGDVAAFLARQVSDLTYSGRAVGIST